MSLSVPTGTKPRSDAELAQLATSPTWTQSPNGWFDRSAHEEDDTATSTHASASLDGQFDQPDFLDDVEGTNSLSTFSPVVSLLSLQGAHTYILSPFPPLFGVFLGGFCVF